MTSTVESLNSTQEEPDIFAEEPMATEAGTEEPLATDEPMATNASQILTISNPDQGSNTGVTQPMSETSITVTSSEDTSTPSIEEMPPPSAMISSGSSVAVVPQPMTSVSRKRKADGNFTY